MGPADPQRPLWQCPVTLIYVAACIGLHLVMRDALGPPGPAGWASEDLIRFGGMERSLLWDGEWWRLFTSSVAHVEGSHLFGNVVGLVIFGSWVERRIGSWNTSLVVLLGAATASTASMLMHDVTSVGASGVAYAVIATWMALEVRAAGSVRALLRKRRFLWIAGSLVAFEVLGALAVQGLAQLIRFEVDHGAHLGGFVAGLFLGGLLPLQRSWRRRAAAGLAAAGLMGILIGLVTRPWPGQRSMRREAALSDEAWDRQDYEEVLRRIERFDDEEWRGIFRLRQASAELLLGRYEAAIETASRGIAEVDPCGHHPLSSLDLDGRRVTQEPDGFRALLQPGPTHDREGCELRLIRADAAAELGRIEEARDDLAVVHAADPTEIDWLVSRARILYDIGDVVAAKEAIDGLPEVEDSYARSIICSVATEHARLEGGDLREAKRACDQALAAAPDDLSSLVNRGLVLRLLDDYAAARADYRRALAIDGEDFDALTGACACSLGLEEWGRARAEAEAIIERYPNRYLGYWLRADAELEEEELKAALADYDRAWNLAEEEAVKVEIAQTRSALRDYLEQATGG